MALRLDFIGQKPLLAHEGDAGLDLYASATTTFEPGTSRKVGTGTRVAIPNGYFGMLLGRSSMGVNRGLRLANSVGIIDSGYRGELIVAMHNDDPRQQVIEEGERVAQLVIVPFAQVILNRVQAFDVTERGEGGFGSSGRV